MTIVAATRPGEWNLPLFVHVLGALALIGALALAAGFLFAARRDGSIEMLRVGFRSLLVAALPAFVVMRIGAQWIASEEGLDDADVTWITLGYISTEPGLPVLIAATVLAGLAVRRARQTDGASGVGTGVAVASWLVSGLIVLYAVVIWAMASKPG